MFSKWILETFESNNDIYELDLWRGKSGFVVLLSWITLRQSVDQSTFKLPWDKNLNRSQLSYQTADFLNTKLILRRNLMESQPAIINLRVLSADWT